MNTYANHIVSHVFLVSIPHYNTHIYVSHYEKWLHKARILGTSRVLLLHTNHKTMNSHKG